MRLKSVSDVFPDLPRYHYFECGNKYTGSRGTFRFCITPAEKLCVEIWHGLLCREKSEIEKEEEFENSADGFDKMLEYLEGEAKKTEKEDIPAWLSYEGWSRGYVDKFQTLLAEEYEKGDFLKEKN